MSDPHASASPQVDDEPKTPMWLPGLGATLFVAAGLWWAVTPSAAPPASDAAAVTSASASASAAAPAPRPTPTPRPSPSPPTMPAPTPSNSGKPMRAHPAPGGAPPGMQPLPPGLQPHVGNRPQP